MSHTLIIDNNKAYSSHRIYFVEAPSDFKEYLSDLEKFLKENDDDPDTTYTVLGQGEIEWFEGKKMSIGQFLEDMTYSCYSDLAILPKYHGQSVDELIQRQT